MGRKRQALQKRSVWSLVRVALVSSRNSDARRYSQLSLEDRLPLSEKILRKRRWHIEEGAPEVRRRRHATRPSNKERGTPYSDFANDPAHMALVARACATKADGVSHLKSRRIERRARSGTLTRGTTW
jgi:hypothetical protein